MAGRLPTTVEKGYEKYTNLTVTETQLVKVSFKMAEGTSGWTISGAPDYVAKGSNSITLTVANANWSDSWSLTFTLNGKQVSTAADSGKTSKEITFSDTNIDADGTYTITVA